MKSFWDFLNVVSSEVNSAIQNNETKLTRLQQNILAIAKERELRKQMIETTNAYRKIYGDKVFKIGVMGKSGAGKSTFINSLCQAAVCETGGSGGVTRSLQKITGQLGEMNVEIFDFPGIAENQKWDKQYLDLYKDHLEKLDLIFWTIKLDDRALMEDEQFFSTHISYSLKEKFIFILSQSDKAEPTREWNNYSFSPSERQKDRINRNHVRIAMDFGAEYNNIIPVASSYTKNETDIKVYNFDSVLDCILFKLVTLDKINYELSISTSWDITKKECKKAIEMSRLGWKYSAEDTQRLSEELSARISELKSKC